MSLQRTGAWLGALALLTVGAIQFRGEQPLDFGVIDPAYRNESSDVAWFINQNGDDITALVDALRALDAVAIAQAERPEQQ
jgi:hypothetical protein